MYCLTQIQNFNPAIFDELVIHLLVNWYISKYSIFQLVLIVHFITFRTFSKTKRNTICQTALTSLSIYILNDDMMCFHQKQKLFFIHMDELTLWLMWWYLELSSPHFSKWKNITKILKSKANSKTVNP